MVPMIVRIRSIEMEKLSISSIPETGFNGNPSV